MFCFCKADLLATNIIDVAISADERVSQQPVEVETKSIIQSQCTLAVIKFQISNVFGGRDDQIFAVDGEDQVWQSGGLGARNGVKSGREVIPKNCVFKLILTQKTNWAPEASMTASTASDGPYKKEVPVSEMADKSLEENVPTTNLSMANCQYPCLVIGV